MPRGGRNNKMSEFMVDAKLKYLLPIKNILRMIIPEKLTIGLILLIVIKEIRE